jgi:hypothetical protein
LVEGISGLWALSKVGEDGGGDERGDDDIFSVELRI